jgi:hypothetical protein
MKSLTKLVIVVMMALTVLGSTNVAFAQENVPIDVEAGRGARGKVTEVGADGLVITTPAGHNVAVQVNSQTKIWIVEDERQGDLSDIQVGNFVGVRGQREDDSIEARIIIVLSEDPRNLAKVGGKVTAVKGKVIEVENRQGVHQITTDDNTRFRVGKKEEASLKDINEGDPVFAAGVKQDDGTFLARLVVLVTGEQLRRHTLRGEVLSVDPENRLLTVEARGQKEGVWTVNTTEETRYRVPGVQNPTLADINAEDHVLVVGRPNEDAEKSGTARLIAVIPERFRDAALVRGEVTGVNNGHQTFTLHTLRGDDITVLTDESTRYRTRDDQDVSFKDINKGTKVVVIGKRVEDQASTIQAKIVGIQLAPPGDD